LWLDILNNENLLLAAETLIIVVGSMLLGILLSYLTAGGNRQKLAGLEASLEEERKQSDALRDQVMQITHERAESLAVNDALKSKISDQARTIFDLQQQVFQKEADQRKQQAELEALKTTLDSFEYRIDVLRKELETSPAQEDIPLKSIVTAPLRANYEHVSKLLGKQVTENDLTIIAGIGPKTASLLQSNGIRSWNDLANTGVDDLRTILADAGGVYKNQDPTHWAKQALMASLGEWRKLRVFQESLKKLE